MTANSSGKQQLSEIMKVQTVQQVQQLLPAKSENSQLITQSENIVTQTSK